MTIKEISRYYLQVSKNLSLGLNLTKKSAKKKRGRMNLVNQSSGLQGMLHVCLKTNTLISCSVSIYGH